MTTTKSLKKLIEAGKFDYVNPKITEENFPPQEVGTEFELVHFDRNISSEDAVKELSKDGWRPANAYDLLSWKDWNGKHTVVALGSVAEVPGGRRVLCLCEGRLGRGLYLGWWDGVWSADSRFLKVRNSKTKEI